MDRLLSRRTSIAERARRFLRALHHTTHHAMERSRQRRALARLDDTLLADIGLSRAEAGRETRKPFWRR